MLMRNLCGTLWVRVKQRVAEVKRLDFITSCERAKRSESSYASNCDLMDDIVVQRSSGAEPV